MALDQPPLSLATGLALLLAAAVIATTLQPHRLPHRSSVPWTPAAFGTRCRCGFTAALALQAS